MFTPRLIVPCLVALSLYGAAPAAAQVSTSSFPPYDGRGRVLTGTRHERHNDRGLWGAGLGLMLGGRVLDMAVTAIGNAVSNDRSPAAEEDAQAWSFLPFAGPIIQLGVGAPHPAIPITTGLMQIGGLVLFIVGLTSEHDVEVPVYAWGDPSDPRTATLGLDVMPTDGGAYATLTLHAM